jgi:predicted metallopeptidase
LPNGLRNYLIPPIASRELRNIVVSLGAAIDHIPVTNAVVIKTTKTHPGTSARLFPLRKLIRKLRTIRILNINF